MLGGNRGLAVVISGLLLTEPAVAQVPVVVAWELDIKGVTNEMDVPQVRDRVNALNTQWARQFKTIIPVLDFVPLTLSEGDTQPDKDVIQLKVVAKSLGTQPSSD